MIFSKKQNLSIIEEENIKIPIYGEKISKELKVFYNPDMKLNRDISLLVIKSFFNKKIIFCDPMCASGIRELRFQKVIPEMFLEMIVGDISKTALLNTKKNFKFNKLKTFNIKFLNQDAINTISTKYFHFIEIDPFGSPVPYLDIALQRIKHDSILSVTATDTAALCGTYPKTTFRKYNIKVEKLPSYEEIGLRNLIAFCQIQASKYSLYLKPLISYSSKHYYKVFFQTIDSKEFALNSVLDLKYINYDKKTQEIILKEYQDEKSIGKTYVKELNDKDFIEKLKKNLFLLEKKNEAEKLLNKLFEELDVVGSYNIHLLQKEYNLKNQKSFDFIISELEKETFLASKCHNNKFSIKTNAPLEIILNILKK